jgi:magnesium chelatase subunit I
MRLLTRFLDREVPYLDIPGCPVHEDPYHPITQQGKRFLMATPEAKVPIAWWPREERYAERLAPGTKFEDIPDGWACPVCGATKDSFEQM